MASIDNGGACGGGIYGSNFDRSDKLWQWSKVWKIYKNFGVKENKKGDDV
ncbi:MAG TPA: hypothetical protein IGS52_03565 [Oscillatoriaceae cyanobacterium M33_DOE_052]|nr:hypothetical protein [Oscillatoriaceae cyanobacterium M33_DOE_052]